MAGSRIPGSVKAHSHGAYLPARSPGALGVNDAGEPLSDRHVGDTHGPVGHNGHGAPRHIHAKKRRKGARHL